MLFPKLAYTFLLFILIPAQVPEPTALETVLTNVHVSGEMASILRSIHDKEPSFIVFGFEKAAIGTPVEITLNGEKASLDVLLRSAVTQDGRYDFRLTDGGVVEVFPKERFGDRRGILNFPSKLVEIHERRTVGNYIREIVLTDADFRAGLRRAGVTLPQRSGAGSSVRGNYDPMINVHLENTTLRQVLNALSAESLKISRRGPIDDSAEPQPAVGWIFDPNGTLEGTDGQPRLIDSF